MLNNLGILLKCRLEHTHDIADITTAITVQQRAVQLTKDDDPNLSDRLSNLASSFEDRFEHTSKLADITEAISAFRRAIELTLATHPNLLSRLSDLGLCLFSSFKHSGRLEEADEAISLLQRAVGLTPPEHATRAIVFTNLGSAWLARFERTGKLGDLTESISFFEKAADIFPDDHPSRAGMLNNISGSLLSRFERTRDVDDLFRAISRLREAVKLTDKGHAHLPFMLNNLGRSLSMRFDLLGKPEDLSEAIAVVNDAVSATPEGDWHSQLPAQLNTLGNLYLRRFQRNDDLEDITMATKALQRAIQLTPHDHAELPTRLNNLGNMFLFRFPRSGDPADIAEAIAKQQRALLLTPDDHPEFASWLNNLGNSLMSRFESGGVTHDIDEAIKALQKSVELTPEDHQELAVRLTNLANMLKHRFKCTNDLRDIDEAISVQQKALHLTPNQHAESHGRFGSIGSMLHARFERTRRPSDLAEAILAKQKAVDLANDDRTYLPLWLSKLGVSLHARFDLSGDLSDLDQAILLKRKAVELTPSGHTDLSGRQLTLAHSLNARFVSGGSQDDLSASVSVCKSAATSMYGNPRTKLEAAKRWAVFLNQHNPQSLEILAAYDVAIDLMALTAGLGETVQRRHVRLEGLSGIAVEAASSAFRLGRLDKALEWLEQGRCLVWNQLSNLRTPLDELRHQDAELSKHISTISRRLEMFGSLRARSPANMSFPEKITMEDEAREHMRLAKQWDNLVASVRSLPGFETFLRPAPCSSLLEHLPASGVVVVINISKDRCDAMALEVGQSPIHIPLPGFSLEKAKKYRQELQAQLQSQHIRVRDDGRGPVQRPIGSNNQQTGSVVLRNVLRGLWTDMAKPILERLGLTVSITYLSFVIFSSDCTQRVSSPAGATLPRVWWCPTGPISFLPVHAAGIYADGESESVFDYAVSSYIPTITALNERVRAGRPIDKSVSGLFLTSHAHGIPDKPIPGTTREVESICIAANENVERVLHLDGSDVSINGCLNNMERFSSVHLACHASQDAHEPLSSRFRLEEGPLELGTIIRRNLINADLAFLSACQTSTGEEKLTDEAVHLAAGMLAAGYRRVVATMWSIKDAHASKVAHDFYEYLWSRQEDDNRGVFDASLSAHALHHAVQQLRRRLDSSERSLLAWIPYVHFGY